jgi:hypothetical protein
VDGRGGSQDAAWRTPAGLRYTPPMRALSLLLLAALPLAAADPEEKPVLAAVQALFDGMAAHDAEAVKATMTPDARLSSVRDGKVGPTRTRDEKAQAVAGNPAALLERMWEPKVFVRGGIATVWTEYDFHADGKLHHCGIDTFLLLKTVAGWKIFSGTYTAETEGCKPSPLGPPK